jgi:hypothetical protein
VVVFQPYKHYHGQAINAAVKTDAEEFIKIDFCQECQGAPRAWRSKLKSWL